VQGGHGFAKVLLSSKVRDEELAPAAKLDK
jgi:hypothetical protein